MELEQVPGWVRSDLCPAHPLRPGDHYRSDITLRCMFCDAEVFFQSRRGNRTKYYTQKRFIIEEMP